MCIPFHFLSQHPHFLMQSYLILYNGIYIPIEAVSLTPLSYIIMNDMYLSV